MVRALEFDPEIVLVKAMDVFWQKGVEHTSISDLVAATGVQRSGLYNVFGSKDELFKSALMLYMKNKLAQNFIELQKPDAKLVDIKAFFNKFTDMSIGAVSVHGCFVCNTASSDAKEAQYVNTLIEQQFSRLEECFYQALKRSRAAGEFNDASTDRQLAQYFVANILSLSNLSRSPVGRNLAKSYLAELLMRLDSLQ
ncbi:MAG: TetR/AcrR family transcriptional regulator [Thalassotalea sp.]